MKKPTFTLLMIGLVLLMVVPASAAKPAPVGDQISIFYSGSQDFPADTPFHIRHGWGIEPSDGYPISKFSFELEVDGQPREADFVQTEFIPGEEDPLLRRWVHNFPDGMTGVHEFTGRWFAPCQYAVDNGLIPGPCEHRFDPVEVKTEDVEVTFYAP